MDGILGGQPALIDRFMPAFDFRERHATRVDAPAHVVDACARTVDLGASPIVKLLLRLRGMRSDAFRLDAIEQSGFRVLGDEPGSEIVLGLIGRFWTPSGAPCRFEPEAFTTFAEPGWARAAWNFRARPLPDGATLLETETRVQCTDAASRTRFRLYWLVVRPFSGLIRRLALRQIRRAAELAADRREKGAFP